MAKYGLIIDITRADGCGSDILSITDELTGNLNAPTDSEIPEGMAAVWMNMQEVEQGHGDKIKMDYVPKMYPIQGGAAPVEVIYDDPTMQMKWGDLEGDSCAAKFAAENADDITDITPEGSEYKVLAYKLPKPFITGEVTNADASECKQGVKVTCTCKKTGNTKEVVTDFFGDFEFAGLHEGGEYTVQVEGAEPIEVVLDEAKNLGVVKLA